MTVHGQKGKWQRYNCTVPGCAADIAEQSALCIALEGYVCAHGIFIKKMQLI